MGGPPSRGWGCACNWGAQLSSTLTSSSFSRMSFSVSASGTGGMTGMGKSVPLSRVSLLRAERGGEDAATALPAPYGGRSPMGVAAQETPNLAGAQYLPAQTLSPPAQHHAGPFSRQGTDNEQLQAPPQTSAPLNLLHTSLGATEGGTTPARGVRDPQGTELTSCSPHSLFSLLF